ncbi:MAG TPA: hypothetical protein VN240_03345 [Propylenella sp.]|nr:hypothetical protein [Propylenella sp.]
MAASNPRPTDGNVQPAGSAGDGMDPYPTYRDGLVPPHVASGTKPTDSNLPLRRRTHAWPMLIGLALIAAVVIGYLLMGGINTVRTTDDAMSPGGPAATAPAADASGAGGVLERNEEAQTQTGPGEVEVTPSATDVPGGETTTPVQTAPSQ